MVIPKQIFNLYLRKRLLTTLMAVMACLSSPAVQAQSSLNDKQIKEIGRVACKPTEESLTLNECRIILKNGAVYEKLYEIPQSIFLEVATYYSSTRLEYHYINNGDIEIQRRPKRGHKYFSISPFKVTYKSNSIWPFYEIEHKPKEKRHAEIPNLESRIMDVSDYVAKTFLKELEASHIIKK